MTGRENISEQLSAYLDGELPDEDARRVEAALAENAKLAGELEQLRKTRQLIQSLPHAQAGDDFAEKVVQAAVQKGIRASADVQTWRPAPLPNPWRRMLAAAALIVFAVGLGVFVSISLYDIGPKPAPREGLAIKSPEEFEAPTSLGRIARRLEEPAKEEAERIAAGYVAEKSPPSDVMPKSAARPRGLPPPPAAKGAPSRGEQRFFEHKAGEAIEDAGGVLAKGITEAPVRARKGPEEAEAVVLAGPQSTEKLVRLVAPADREVIYTDDLAAGQKQVEAVLAANAVELTPPDQRLLQPNQANLFSYQAAATKVASKSSAAAAPRREVQYVVYGPAEQLQNVRAQLRRDVDVRARQAAARTSTTTDVKMGLAGKPAAPKEPLRIAPIQTPAEQAPAGQAQTPPAASQPADENSLFAQRTASRPTSRQIVQTQANQQNVSQMRQNEPQLREGLIRNQAMLITLEYRPAPK
ncbi:MAG: zf-HC2 domain-containing protein [Phycisphaerae bacterium]|nr:zf-HC2 domain-containing protein [Phycisphaerae bacterium]